eukprot:TRINITY_DN407_c0_g1_i1.p1 TRINITY_DN407_c0_g1~~TRINITY_DN407_c0_g1_i1.p1  ORF type:complete len:142 (+),score=20.53 TRINITY_DN407_c0_g1_i1:64-426(+)
MANLTVVALVSAVLIANLSTSIAAMAATDKKVYIVHLERQDKPVADVEANHVAFLASVVGGHDAAKDAILYSYKYGVYGFSAKLSSDEVNNLTGKPGVLAVVPSGTAKLHSGHQGGAMLQ